jgi:hypothetical protein
MLSQSNVTEKNHSSKDIGFFELNYIGPSMWPTFKEGDIVLMSTEFTSLEIGDLVLFKDVETAEITLHRIVTESPIRTKGDFSLSLDFHSPIPFALVIGLKRAGVNYRWGRRGQTLKKIMASLSKKRLSSVLVRRLALVGIYFLTIFSFLICDKSKDHRI